MLCLCQQTSNPITHNCWQVKFFHKQATKEGCITFFFRVGLKHLARKIITSRSFKLWNYLSNSQILKKRRHYSLMNSFLYGQKEPDLPFICLSIRIKMVATNRQVTSLLLLHCFRIHGWDKKFKTGNKFCTEDILRDLTESNVNSNLKIKYFTLWIYFSHE